jgi:hypothetical protein
MEKRREAFPAPHAMQEMKVETLDRRIFKLGVASLDFSFYQGYFDDGMEGGLEGSKGW